MKKIELLAPAKNLEYAKAAIDCGADAVYVGAPQFGARSAVGNKIEDIQQIVEYAHIYGAKVYVALNTILNDNEIVEAQKTITELYKIKVDALIIQDMGLLELDLPPIALHASTQCHNDSTEKVDFLEKVGFKRVILARELELNQIKDIKKQTNIELEAFIHGALCVSYSGQCYMSYAIGGRSGNRGECAQPCRKKYSLIDENNKILLKDKHLLCLKDLNLSESLEDLIDAGVSSFKIEGRLKDINYVKNIVSFYRQKLDEIIDKKKMERSSFGKSFIEFMPNPYKTFNRGYCSYFINGRTTDIASLYTPKSLGEKIGRVREVKKDCFKIESSADLNQGDGICFFDSNNILQGTTINKLSNGYVYPQKISLISPKTIIYRNYDHLFTKKLEKTAITRKLYLDLSLKIDEKSIILEAFCENGISDKIIIENTFELAINSQNIKENFEKQLSKLGGTPFEARNIELDRIMPYFIPVSKLNEIRRTLVENLINSSIKKHAPTPIKAEKNDYPFFEKELFYNANIINKYAKSFYERHGAKVIEFGAESNIDLSEKKLMTTKFCLRNELGICLKNKNDNKETLFLIDEFNKKYKLNFDCKKCRMEILN